MTDNEKQTLKNLFFKAEYLDRAYTECIEFALCQIEKGNLESKISILAGLNPNTKTEIKGTIECIVDEKLDETNSSKEDWVGEYLTELSDKYIRNEIGISDIDLELNHVYMKLDYPDWMATLCYNSEYATDIESYKKPFENELEYISNLWKTSKDKEEFMRRYDPDISEAHRGRFVSK
jgi:hypothetical protein